MRRTNRRVRGVTNKQTEHIGSCGCGEEHDNVSRVLVAGHLHKADPEELSLSDIMAAFMSKNGSVCNITCYMHWSASYPC
jgi:hypothetical protein